MKMKNLGLMPLSLMILIFFIIVLVPRHDEDAAEVRRSLAENSFQLRNEMEKAWAAEQPMKNSFIGHGTLHSAMWEEDLITRDEYVTKIKNFFPPMISGEYLNSLEGYLRFFRGNAEKFYDISKVHGLNPMYVFALGLQQSKYGTSQIAVENCNLFDIGGNTHNDAAIFENVEANIRFLCATLELYAKAGTWQYNEILEFGGDPSSIEGQIELYLGSPDSSIEIFKLMKEIFN